MARRSDAIGFPGAFPFPFAVGPVIAADSDEVGVVEASLGTVPRREMRVGFPMALAETPFGGGPNESLRRFIERRFEVRLRPLRPS